MKLKIITGIMLILLMLIMVITLAGKASRPHATTQTNPTTTLYLDPPTINGTEIGVNNTITIDIKISNAIDVYGWQAGLIFNPDLLECTGFFEGEFLSDVGPTYWINATINNTAGVIDASGCIFLGDYKTSGDGRLAYLTFKVKATGVSDLHLRDVMVVDYNSNEVPINIIDVYTVIVDATSHKVVTVSNSSGSTGKYHSGFYDHSFNVSAEEISFKVTSPYSSFSNVTIPKTLLEPEPLHVWRVIIDGLPVSITITENATHTSIYFKYSSGIHEVHITTRPLVTSIISIALSSTSITFGSNVTINGAIDPARPNVTVHIEYRTSGITDGWTVLAIVLTDQNSNYNHTWKPIEAGTYEVRARWEGDNITLSAESDVLTLKVRPILEVLWNDKAFYVIVETNSPLVADLNFSQSMKQIGFNVTGPNGTIGFCNVTIPKQLLDGEPWMVKIDGLLVPFVETENETHTFLYFTYTHSTKTVEIRGTDVIPEFPTAIILPLSVFFTLIAVAITKKIGQKKKLAKTT